MRSKNHRRILNEKPSCAIGKGQTARINPQVCFESFPEFAVTGAASNYYGAQQNQRYVNDTMAKV
jgi:hypothetical protein